ARGLQMCTQQTFSQLIHMPQKMFKMTYILVSASNITTHEEITEFTVNKRQSFHSHRQHLPLKYNMPGRSQPFCKPLLKEILNGRLIVAKTVQEMAINIPNEMLVYTYITSDSFGTSCEGISSERSLISSNLGPPISYRRMYHIRASASSSYAING
ncbi:hypothetical protein L9F63_028085, partial [Diploptera punctata]